MAVLEQSGGVRVRLGLKGTMRLLLPYFREKFFEQVKSIGFIILYLLLFQALVLQVPIVYASMIALGIFLVALGLMFFMEGLRIGLMPLGETIGALLPRNAKMPVILGFAFLLGLGATFAEPAIAVLKAAGSNIPAEQAPLLYSLLNDFAGRLVFCVGTGVGVAVLVGVLRFFYGWSLKTLLYPTIGLLCVIMLWVTNDPLLAPIIGLAWDCGAVATGPVTVPLVLALGIGVCRIVGSEESGNAGFGIVTLASIFPAIAVLILALVHYYTGNYYGGPHYSGESHLAGPMGLSTEALGLEAEAKALQALEESSEVGITPEEYEHYLATGELPKGVQLRYEGGTLEWKGGRILHHGASLVYERVEAPSLWSEEVEDWDPQSNLFVQGGKAALAAMQAILPLCAFLFFTLYVVLRERLKRLDEMLVGIGFAVTGMFLFGLGIEMGLTPLGSQLGGNIPASFAKIHPWGMEGSVGPIVGTGLSGKVLVVFFAFFLGYGATLAEPALIALSDTVQRITAGAFRKGLLIHSVAIGVGLGIAVGVIKVMYDLPLVWLVLPPCLLLLFLTWLSSEEFVNFAWDSAGVTTGPITVPLVLSMGLGIGAAIPGDTNGFGILALAFTGPVISVLLVGLIVRKTSKVAEKGAFHV